MIKGELKVKDNWAGMVKIEAKYRKGAERVVKDTADFFANDIRDNWSASSPSNPGKPPAVVTGNLDESVIAEDQGRDQGRFAGKDAFVWYVHFDTDNDDRGQYALALEEGVPDRNLKPRPFVKPALKRAKTFFRAELKRRLS